MVFITRIVGSILVLASIAAAMQDDSSKYDDNASNSNSNYDGNNKGSDSWDSGSSKYDDSAPKDSSNYDGSNKGSDGSSNYDGNNKGSDDSSNYDGNKGSDSWDTSAAPAESAMASGSAMSSDASSSVATSEAAKTTDMAAMTTESAMTSETAAATTTAAATSEMTTAAPATTSSVVYGSGSSGNQPMDDCVQQCMAKYSLSAGSSTAAAATDASVTATATDALVTATATDASASASGGGGAGGATHTVVVSPSQGVLRYIPFALNASVGDTVQFMWGANNHTVTKGSQLLPCNKSAEEPSFTSGLQQKDFMFTEVVNTTDPTFIFCNTPTPDGANHCAKGMFFILNPPSNSGASTSVGGAMQSAKAKNPTLEAYATYTDNMTEGLSMASWGTHIDIGGMPDWSHSLVMENVLFTRNVFAANPDMEDADGSWSVGAMGSNPMVVPLDVSEAVAASSGDAYASGGNNAGAASPTASPSPSASAGAQSGALDNGNSAFMVSSSKAQIYITLSVIMVTLFSL